MAAKKRVEEPEEPSRAAGGCVLVVLGGGAAAVVFAVSPEAGVLAVWVVGAVAVWRAARRRMSVQGAANPAPPPEEEPPSCSECAGQEPVTVTPEKGMLIYGYALPDRPNHTHVHLAQRTLNP